MALVQICIQLILECRKVLLPFLNDLLCLTSKPIYSFADDSSLCHSYSYNAHPNLNEVGVFRNYMDDTLNSDLQEWGRANIVEFNARKTQLTSEPQILAKTFV